MTGAVLYSAWGGAGKDRKADVFQDGRVEFTPNRCAFWAWPLLVIYLAYATFNQFTHAQKSPLSLMSAMVVAFFTVMIAISFPSKIVAASDGLEQVRWLWKNKRIRWNEIVEINTGEKSRIVTVMGADGTKIVQPPATR